MQLSLTRSPSAWLAAALILLAAGPARAAAPAEASVSTPPGRTWTVGGHAAIGVGYFYATHIKLGASIERRLLNEHLTLAGLLLLIGGDELLALQTSLQLGLRLVANRRLTVVPALRVGYAVARVGLPVGSRAGHDVVTSGLCEFRLALAPSWRLGVTPLALTVYLPDPWGAVLEPQASLLYLF